MGNIKFIFKKVKGKKMKWIKNTRSLCPVCIKPIDASIYEKDNKIIMRKKCEEHGKFDVLVWSDAELYHRFMKYSYVGNGIENPQTRRRKGCPLDCGLCNEHKSHTLLGIVYVTNKCNLNCNICFDNVRKTGYFYEPTISQIKKKLVLLRSEKPVPTYAIQITGGEPTLRKDLPKILQIAKKLGFLNIEVNTNGIVFANNIKFFKKCMKSGMDTVYLSFEGVTEIPYEMKVGKGFGKYMLNIKKKVVKNARKIGMRSIVLVPTWTVGINDKETYDIVKYAVDNIDVVRSVNFQPLGLTGRIRGIQVDSMHRTTTPDCMIALEKQSNGVIRREHFYPIPTVAPFCELVEKVTKKPQVRFSCHPACGAATYIFVEDDKIYPLPEFFNVDKFLNEMVKNRWFLNLISGMGSNVSHIPKMIKSSSITKNFVKSKIESFVNKEKAPSFVDSLIDNISDIALTGDFSVLSEFHFKTLFIGIMHFMGPLDFDTERVQRCQIHYPTIDGRIIPFCKGNLPSRNIGIVLEDVKKKYGRSLSGRIEGIDYAVPI